MSTHYQQGEKAIRHAVDSLRTFKKNNEQQIIYAHVLAAHGSTLCTWFGRYQEASDELEESIAVLRTFPTAQRELAYALGYLGSCMINLSDLDKAIELLNESVRLYGETGPSVQQTWAYCLLGGAMQLQGDFGNSEIWYQRALALAHEIDDQRTIADANLALGRLAILRGQYEVAYLYLEDALSASTNHNIGPFIIGALRGFGHLATVTGDFESASSYLADSLEVAKRWGRKTRAAAECLQTLAELKTAQGDYTTASKLYREVTDFPINISSRKRQLSYLLGKGNLALHMESYSDAQLLYEECLDISSQLHERVYAVQARAGLGRTAIRKGDSITATVLLIEVLEEGMSIGMTPLLLDAICLAAELFAVGDDCAYASQLAMYAFRHQSSTSETKQWAQHLLEQIALESMPDSGEFTMHCGAEVHIERVAMRLVEELKHLCEIQGQITSFDQPQIEPLSQRELQVLRLVAEGKSNREIGRELYLALGTVKSHLHHIFQKLDAKSRTQAVARAIEHRLL